MCTSPQKVREKRGPGDTHTPETKGTKGSQPVGGRCLRSRLGTAATMAAHSAPKSSTLSPTLLQVLTTPGQRTAHHQTCR